MIAALVSDKVSTDARIEFLVQEVYIDGGTFSRFLFFRRGTDVVA